jgi:hypothetical protein
MTGVLLVGRVFGSKSFLIMRCTFVVSLALACVLLPGCASQQDAARDVLVRHHFAGLSALGSRADLSQVREVLGLPQSQMILGDAARKLALQLPTWFGAPAVGTNDAGPLAPVLRALLDAESYLEIGAGQKGPSDWALAARLEGPAAATAGAEIRRVLGAPVAAQPGEAFEIAIGTAKVPARFVASNGWIILGSGRGAFDRFEAALRSGGRPGPASTNAVLEGEADLTRIAPWIGLRPKPPGPVDQWPKLQLSMEPRNGRLRTSARMKFPGPLNLSSEPWLMPTNVLRDPLVGFTAARGAETWLSRLGLFSDLGVTEWPKQLFLWSLAGDPWQQYFSGPIASPTNLMAQIALTLPVRAVTNMAWSGTPFTLRITNQATRVELHGLPYFSPFMNAQRLADHEQLIGGLFPLSSNSRQPAPGGLVAQVAGRTNLVIYDWETTGRRLFRTNAPNLPGPRILTNNIGRLIQFKHLVQFARLMYNQKATKLPTNTEGELLIPGTDWIDAALPLLGDTVTEVSRTGPAELSLLRQSVTGFNSMELLYLLRWIDNPGFPGWQEPPPAPERPAAPSDLRTQQPKAPGTP